MATKKKNPCWPGYEPVPGKAKMTKGSCKKTTSKATKKRTAK